MPMLKITIALVVSTFSITTMAAEIDITTAYGNGADSYVSSRSGQLDSNFGSGENLIVKNDFSNPPTGWDRKAYIRFDLSSYSGSLANAVLDLGVLSNPNTSDTIDVFGLNDGHVGENWGENTITWNNAPANHLTGSSVIGADTTFLGSFVVTNESLGDRATHSSSSFIDFLNADSNNLATLILVRDNPSSSGVQFASDDSLAVNPGPILTVSTVPLPAAAWLFGSALLGLGALKRRKA